MTTTSLCYTLIFWAIQWLLISSNSSLIMLTRSEMCTWFACCHAFDKHYAGSNIISSLPLYLQLTMILFCTAILNECVLADFNGVYTTNSGDKFIVGSKTSIQEAYTHTHTTPGDLGLSYFHNCCSLKYCSWTLHCVSSGSCQAHESISFFVDIPQCLEACSHMEMKLRISMWTGNSNLRLNLHMVCDLQLGAPADIANSSALLKILCQCVCWCWTYSIPNLALPLASTCWWDHEIISCTVGFVSHTINIQVYSYFVTCMWLHWVFWALQLLLSP